MINSDEDLQKILHLVSAGTSNLKLRLDVYLDYYGKTLMFWRKSNPKQYREELEKAKIRFENGVVNAEVEMLAMIKIDYEYSLKNDEKVSPFTDSLNSYMVSNKELIGD
jgi:hypothetical protein